MVVRELLSDDAVDMWMSPVVKSEELLAPPGPKA